MRLPWPLRTKAALRTGVAVVVVVAMAVATFEYHQARNVRVPLLSAAVGIGPDGSRVMLVPGSPVVLHPGTRVLSGPGTDAEARRQAAWLALGTVPGRQGPHHDMVRSALLDLDTLRLTNGAAIAAWPTAWRYVWPRDASFAAVALARTGHPNDALQMMEFVQSQQPPSGLLQARYRPDGSGPPDARGEESDGIGWVLWATAQLSAAAPDAAARADLLKRLSSLIERSTDAALGLTSGSGALPPASLDYWEVKDSRLSLGTVAALALGLESATDLERDLGNTARSAIVQARAGELRASIGAHFGPAGYPRYLGDDAPDASVAFLLPPFTTGSGAARADPTVLAAWRNAMRLMARPAGGLAPGTDWKQDGISWTPETALFALTAASTGDRATANRLMNWLSEHRTAYGAVPEKVLSNGAPAGPAPLGWSDALIVLTALSLEQGP